MPRRRITLEEGLAEESKRLREQADHLPMGHEREALSKDQAWPTRVGLEMNLIWLPVLAPKAHRKKTLRGLTAPASNRLEPFKGCLDGGMALHFSRIASAIEGARDMELEYCLCGRRSALLSLYAHALRARDRSPALRKF
jgi:hypothetical protein